MAPYDEPLRSELLGGKFTILVGASHFSFGRNLLSTDQCVYKSASYAQSYAIQPLTVG